MKKNKEINKGKAKILSMVENWLDSFSDKLEVDVHKSPNVFVISKRTPPKA